MYHFKSKMVILSFLLMALVSQPCTTQQGSVDSIRVNPKSAMYRSLVFPGWGQWHNGSKLKSLLVFSAQSACIVGYFYEKDRIKDVNQILSDFGTISDNNQALYDHYLSNRSFYEDEKRKYAWWYGGLVIYSMLDSYIDAFLKDFDDNMNIHIETNISDGGARLSINYTPLNLFRRKN